MSTAVQLKLLTLLNVSAVKRPFDLDQPGGHKRSSLTPDTQDSRSLQSEEQEPKKKKQKRRIVLGGEIGPSGSEAKLIGEQKAKKDKKGKAKAGKVEEARAVSEPLEDEEETSGGLDLQAEDDSEDEDEATGRTTPVTGKLRICVRLAP
jgi:U3 small nucleolar RNA-associated protein 25